VGVDSVEIDHGELGECLFPIGGHLPFDEPAGGFPWGCPGASFFLLTVAGSFVFDVADREPEQLVATDRAEGGSTDGLAA
jgi:hypothetical protein